MAASSKDLDIERQISEAINDAKCLHLNDNDSESVLQLINDYLGDGVDSDDEDLTPEEQGDFYDYEHNHGDESDDGDDDDDDDEQDTVPEEESQPTPMDVDSDEEPMIDVLANGDPEFMSEDDQKEMEFIRTRRCRCKDPYAGLGCTHKFPDDYIFQTRMQMNALAPREKMIFLLGKLSSSGVRAGHMTESTKQTQKERQRKRSAMGYHVDGRRVCRDSYCFIYKVSDKYITKLMKHYVTNGIEVMEKRSGGAQQNARKFSLEDIKRAVTFITKFAEERALTIPGRVPSVKSSDPRIRLLPAVENRTSIWRKYRKSLQELNASNGTDHRVMGRTSFVTAWKRHIPFILTTKPRTDLCWTCQRYTQKIYHGANTSIQTKRELLDNHLEHLRVVDLERQVYQSDVAAAKEMIKDIPAQLGPHLPNSMEGAMHYSFDFAQQIFYPHDPEQPGPIYFLTPRKCGIFGIQCEGLSRQVNFLIDEGMATTKGANAVISYLHFYFANYSLGERILYLHCDNCSGQNKNKFVIWYLMWRVLTGLHEEIHLRFLVAGHTKFAPDWSFGLLKQRYMRSHVSCLDDIADVCRSSSQSGVNIPQIVGTELGDLIVTMYDWKSFLDPYFRPVVGIKALHHLSVSKASPGFVSTREFNDSETVKTRLLLTEEFPSGIPEVIPPPGLDLKRQWYLYKKIRAFCAQDNRADITCPRPPQEEMPGVKRKRDDDEEGPEGVLDE